MGVVRLGSRTSAHRRRHASALAVAGATIMLACAALLPALIQR
jgi:hypothetical protein